MNKHIGNLTCFLNWIDFLRDIGLFPLFGACTSLVLWNEGHERCSGCVPLRCFGFLSLLAHFCLSFKCLHQALSPARHSFVDCLFCRFPPSYESTLTSLFCIYLVDLELFIYPYHIYLTLTLQGQRL